jgi:DNA-directed RNA polymerase sigma subunit (sigma70/sigma32)
VSSGAKRRQTLAKVARERAVKEKRARKLEKRELRKQAAAERAAEATTDAEDTEPELDASDEQARELLPGS